MKQATVLNVAPESRHAAELNVSCLMWTKVFLDSENAHEMIEWWAENMYVIHWNIVQRLLWFRALELEQSWQTPLDDGDITGLGYVFCDPPILLVFTAPHLRNEFTFSGPEQE